jgi:hypothetical protein
MPASVQGPLAVRGSAFAGNLDRGMLREMADATAGIHRGARGCGGFIGMAVRGAGAAARNDPAYRGAHSVG